MASSASQGQTSPSTHGLDASATRLRTFSALQFRNYRLFWTGQVVSVTGTFMQSTAQQWLVLKLSGGNPLTLGVVGALQFGPLILPLGGAVADRWPRRNVLVVTQALSAVLAFVLFLLTAAHVAQIWHVCLLAFLLGVVNMVDMPTRQAFVSELVPADHLLNAVSLNSAQFNVARIAGPGVGGALIARLGIPLLFLLNAFSFLAVIGGLLLIRPSELMPIPQRDPLHGVARIRAIGDGFRFIRGNKSMLIAFIMVTVIGTMGFNFNVLLPLEATDVLHADAVVFGLLTSSLGVGALIGALVLARRGGAPTNRLLIGMAAVFGLLETAVALPRSIPLTLAVIACTGFFMSSFSAAANTRMQLSSPPELRGRVMSVYSMVFIGTTPIGNLIVGAVASTAGVRWSFVVSGLPCFASALFALYLWRRWGARANATLYRAPAAAPLTEALAESPPTDTPPLALPTMPDAAYDMREPLSQR
jgi:MFS family permease